MEKITDFRPRLDKPDLTHIPQICTPVARLCKYPLRKTRFWKTVTIEYLENHQCHKKACLIQFYGKHIKLWGKDLEIAEKLKVEKQRKEAEEVNRIRNKLVITRGKRVKMNLLSLNSESLNRNPSDLENTDDYEVLIEDKGEDQWLIQNLPEEDLLTIFSSPSPISGRTAYPIFEFSDPFNARLSSISRLSLRYKIKKKKLLSSERREGWRMSGAGGDCAGGVDGY
ncbi:hypothetical protein OnM2_097018 [Erysiphe neolycopersici]|uniref:Uncharacterized protein n=1 Tax=Erysiphe neolycopersici TaxID=212602 RepID=A0A420HAK5_9PEZI|nr:hypothetical protein OnM2_097018 [Erysiphe neolycopersici]